MWKRSFRRRSEMNREESMKGKVLKIFAAILGISGAILALVNIFES